MLIITFHDQDFVFTPTNTTYPVLIRLLTLCLNIPALVSFAIRGGIDAALQHELIRLLINEDLFWLGVAKHLGSTPPPQN